MIITFLLKLVTDRKPGADTSPRTFDFKLRSFGVNSFRFDLQHRNIFQFKERFLPRLNCTPNPSPAENVLKSPVRFTSSIGSTPAGGSKFTSKGTPAE